MNEFTFFGNGRLKGLKIRFPQGLFVCAASWDPYKSKKTQNFILSKMSGLAKFTVNSYWPTSFTIYKSFPNSLPIIRVSDGRMGISGIY